MRYDPGCPLPDLVKSTPHVAFEVDDLTAELVGREVIIELSSPSDGVLVAFVFEDGALSISTYGAALQDGCAGDVISLRNLETGLTVSGTIQADGSVRLSGG